MPANSETFIPLLLPPSDARFFPFPFPFPFALPLPFFFCLPPSSPSPSLALSSSSSSASDASDASASDSYFTYYIVSFDNNDDMSLNHYNKNKSRKGRVHMTDSGSSFSPRPRTPPP